MGDIEKSVFNTIQQMDKFDEMKDSMKLAESFVNGINLVKKIK